MISTLEAEGKENNWDINTNFFFRKKQTKCYLQHLQMSYY